jgi:hypothetical protein
MLPFGPISVVNLHVGRASSTRTPFGRISPSFRGSPRNCTGTVPWAGCGAAS